MDGADETIRKIAARLRNERLRNETVARVGVPAGVALVAIAVRLPHVFTDALSQDEIASARILREPTLPEMLGRVVRTESTPPLWYTLGWLAHRVGVATVDVRLLSVLFGGLLAAATVALARPLLSSGQAAVAGLLVAVGAQFVAHGAELRAYELLALLAAMLSLALRRELRAPGLTSELALAGVAAAGVLTHYFFLFSVAAALVWLWLEPAARVIRRRASAAIALGLAACLPWTPYFLRQYRHDRFWWIGPFRLRAVLGTPFRLFTPLVSHGPAGRIVPPLFLAIVVVGAFAIARRSPAGRLCALLALAPLAIAASAWLAGFRIFASRNLIGIGPFVAVALVGAVSLVPARVRTVAVAGLAAAGLAGFALAQRPLAPPSAAIARALVREGWQARDPVAVFGDFFDVRAPLEWYLPRQPVLAVSRPNVQPCRTVFVIEHAGARPRLGDVRSGEHVGRYVVARLALDRPIRRSSLRRATILADPAARPACLGILDDRRLAPIV